MCLLMVYRDTAVAADLLMGITELYLAAICHPDLSDSHHYSPCSKQVTLDQDSAAVT